MLTLVAGSGGALLAKVRKMGVVVVAQVRGVGVSGLNVSETLPSHLSPVVCPDMCRG